MASRSRPPPRALAKRRRRVLASSGVELRPRGLQDGDLTIELASLERFVVGGGRNGRRAEVGRRRPLEPLHHVQVLRARGRLQLAGCLPERLGVASTVGRERLEGGILASPAAGPAGPTQAPANTRLLPSSR